MDMEKKILQIFDESQRTTTEDVLEAFNWIDSEHDTIERRIDELQEKKRELVKRRTQLLSNLSVHEALTDSLPLEAELEWEEPLGEDDED